MSVRICKNGPWATRTAAIGTLVVVLLSFSGCPTPVPPSNKAFTSFEFEGCGHLAGAISESQGTISVPWPFAVVKNNLTAVFTTTGASVTVGGVEQISGTTVNNFTNPVTYRVTAQDGSVRDYTVTVGRSTVAQIQGVVTTLAGTPPACTDGFGSAARFNGPFSVAAYDGYLYVADYLNSVIRRINLSTQETTVFAGSPMQVDSVNGIGTAARFRWPQGIASDGAGNLYVSDPSAGAIRKIEIGTANVTTVANGSAFNWPQGIAIDGGYLYVAERYTNTILRVDASSGATTTFATLAGAQPIGITKIGSTLYAACSGNYTIQSIDIGTAAVTIVAGTAGSSGSTNGTGSDARFIWPKGITSDGTNLYVTDLSSVRAITVPGFVVTTFAGSMSSGYADQTGINARFNSPWGMTADASYLYAADTSNNVIRRIAITGAEVTTLAGTPNIGSADGAGTAALFSRPQYAASDGAYVYTTDSNHTIRRISISTGAVETLAGSAGSSGSTDGTGSIARFSMPAGICTDGQNLYIADTNNHTIRKLVIATREVTTLAGAAGIPESTDGTGTNARFRNPKGITTDGINLYVADKGNHTIRKIVIATQEVTTLAGAAGVPESTDGTGTDARFNAPASITMDGVCLYVADTSNYTIRKIDIETVAVTRLAGTTGTGGHGNGPGDTALFYNPSGISTDGTNVYVQENNYVRRVVIQTRDVTDLAGGSIRGFMDGTGSGARFQEAVGIAADGESVYVADTYNNIIRMIR